MVSSVLGKRSRMRTYANRIRKETADSPAKSVCTEVVKPLQDITNILPVVPPSAQKVKRSIADYFAKPPASAPPSSSDINPSSDHALEHVHSSPYSSSQTPPSSPPPLEPYNTAIKPASRKRRRVTTRPRAIKPTMSQPSKSGKMTPIEEDYDSGTSSDASSWESNVIEEYAEPKITPAGNTSTSIIYRPKGTTGLARSNTFTSSSTKGRNVTGRARSNTRAGGEGMIGEFSDMSYPFPSFYNEDLDKDPSQIARAVSTPIKGSTGFGRPRSNTTAGRDPEKSYPIPAYSDSASKIEATPAGSSKEQNEGGQKENAKPGKLVQTQINLGQNPIVSCNVCKFTHNRTITEDVKAHDKFHQAFVNLAEKLDTDEL
ncbi:hypothetical protein O988_09114 [Pseudogymnoascus sp. VKM F-3808]|nr:hypothetical protein O988_09114 [Pseudogymnoascus sp. VKM F-3808]